MTISDTLQDFLTRGIASTATRARRGDQEAVGLSRKPLSAVWQGLLRMARGRDRISGGQKTLRMAQELRTCRAAMIRFNRAATIASLGASIAHEVSQPLGTIVGHARAGQRWLKASPPSLFEAAASLDQIEDAAWRATAIVESMRALMMADNSGYQPLDLNKVVSDTLNLLGQGSLDAAVTVETRVGDTPLWVRGDLVLLQQVLLNLVVNAIQAMQEAPNPARLTVCVRETRDGAVVEISDTGPGLSPAKLKRVFEPLYTTKPDGVGMGLAICRQIAVCHGGALEARSGSRGGAVFTLSLPCRRDPHGRYAQAA